MLVLDNNRLLPSCLTFRSTKPSPSWTIVAEIVKGIVETSPAFLINLDFADIRSIMANGGVTMMLYGESDRGEEVVHKPSTTRCSTSTFRGQRAS